MPQNEFANKTFLGLTQLLGTRPELREVIPWAAQLDDAIRWSV